MSNPQPVIKWAGGKRAIVDKLLEVSSHTEWERYVDLFSGSLAFPLALNPKNLLLNDINSPLIHTYQTIQDNCGEFLQVLEDFDSDEKNDKESYGQIRESYNRNKTTPSLELAGQFIYLNKRGFNGLYRENQTGEYNVPYKYYKGSIYNQSNIKSLSKWFRDRDIQWESKNYLELIPTLVPGDLVYLDPPYYPKDGVSSFTSYWSTPFKVKEQKELAKAVKYLDRQGVKFILSNTPCDEIKSLYKEFYQESFSTTRSMRSGQGITRSNDQDNEIIITNIDMSPTLVFED